MFLILISKSNLSTTKFFIWKKLHNFKQLKNYSMVGKFSSLNIGAGATSKALSDKTKRKYF